MWDVYEILTDTKTDEDSKGERWPLLGTKRRTKQKDKKRGIMAHS